MSSLGVRVSSRASIACERCRRLRKRCQPPHPCPACQDAGEPCQVRSKARPLRGVVTAHAGQTGSQRPPRSEAQWSPRSSRSVARVQEQVHREQFLSASTQPSQGACSTSDSICYKERLNSIKRLVFDHARINFGYNLECDLTEPWLPLREAQRDVSAAPDDRERLQPSHLNQNDTTRWILAFNASMKILRPMLPDATQLLLMAGGIQHNLEQQQADVTASILRLEDLPMDDVALLFAILAVGSLHSAEYSTSRVFFGESRRLLDGYPGEPTFNLCIAVHIHHIYTLITVTSNSARAIVSMNVQIAHDLGMHQKHETPNRLERLRLYLLIMISDQYSAQTHDTRPAIDVSRLQNGLFDPLIDQEPDILPLIQIMKANYIALGALVDKNRSWDSLTQFEAEIGRECILAQRSISSNYSRRDFGEMYGPLVRLHMFWCQLLLRSPFLAHDAYWVSSSSICLHAAQAILSIYFEMTTPALLIEASQHSSDESGAWPWSSTETVLPPTWRQVQRIMTASFIILLSYWRGELTKLEASRYTSIALLLLFYQSRRWGRAMKGFKSTLKKLATLSDLDLSRGTESLFPHNDTSFSAISEFNGGTSTPEEVHTPLDRANCETETSLGGSPSFVDGLFDDFLTHAWPEDVMMFYSRESEQ